MIPEGALVFDSPVALEYDRASVERVTTDFIDDALEHVEDKTEDFGCLAFVIQGIAMLPSLVHSACTDASERLSERRADRRAKKIIRSVDRGPSALRAGVFLAHSLRMVATSPELSGDVCTLLVRGSDGLGSEFPLRSEDRALLDEMRDRVKSDFDSLPISRSILSFQG